MRKISSLILSVVIVLNMGTSVFANNVSLSDIGNSQYKDSIEYLVNQGVINGYEDNTFRPNQFISIAEGLTIAEKIIGNEENLPDKWEDWNKNSWANTIDIDKRLFLGNFYEVMTYETAAEILLKMSGYETFDTALWFEPSRYELNRYWKNLLVMGYPSSNPDHHYLGVSRGEFCEMVCFVMNYEKGYYIDSNLDIDIKIVPYGNTEMTDNDLFNIKSELLKVPQHILKSFNNNNGVIYVMNEKNWINKFDNIYYGVYQNNTIYIRQGYQYPVNHEMGHYLAEKVVRKGFRLELNSGLIMNTNNIGLDQDDYTLKDKNELFAEAFRCYCNDNGIKIQCPALYEYIDKAVHLINS